MTRQTITETEFEVEEREIERTDYYCDICGGQIEEHENEPAMAEVRIYPKDGGPNASLVGYSHYHTDCMDQFTDNSNYQVLADGSVFEPAPGVDIRRTGRLFSDWAVASSGLIAGIAITSWITNYLVDAFYGPDGDFLVSEIIQFGGGVIAAVSLNTVILLCWIALVTFLAGYPIFAMIKMSNHNDE